MFLVQVQTNMSFPFTEEQKSQLEIKNNKNWILFVILKEIVRFLEKKENSLNQKQKEWAKKHKRHEMFRQHYLSIVELENACNEIKTIYLNKSLTESQKQTPSDKATEELLFISGSISLFREKILNNIDQVYNLMNL